MSVHQGWRLPLFLLAAAVASLWSARPAEKRVVLPAVEAEAFGRWSTPELWERLAVMGVAAVVLREESAAELAARGGVLHFSRAEVEKWRALGLVASGGGPRPDSLWAKDAKALSRVFSALVARGIDVSTPTASSWNGALELPPGVDLARVPAGFDQNVVSVLSAAGLIPVAASTGPSVSVAGQRFWIRTLPAAARASEVRRAVYGRSQRLLILCPNPGLGLEENLESLRAALKVIKRAGWPAVVSSFPTETSSSCGSVRLVLFYAIGLLGPLLAARVGLRAERRVRSRVAASFPIAAPVPEVLAGLAAVWSASSGAGLLAAALLPPVAREALARSWTLWTLSAPLALGAVALFVRPGPALGARWSAPLRVRDLAAAAALVLALACLLAPRASLRVAGIEESAERFLAVADLLWWWPWRWREIFIGVPSLVLALVLVDARQDVNAASEAHGRSFLGDPRGWLTLGLLAPAGMIAAIGAGNVPAGLAVAQGAAAFAFGAALGLALAVLRTRIESRQRSRDPGLLT